jgi:putative membrane protein
VSEAQAWRRLHPLSPIVRGGKATIGVAVVILPSLILRRSGGSHGLYDLGGIAVITALAFVSWLVTRWRLDDDDLQIETGLIRRHSERYPLSQVQSIDIVRPGLARLLGVAELRLRMGGATGSLARLAYLPEREAEPLRARLLALAVRARGDGTPAVEAAKPAEAEEHLLASVPTPQLIASILISDVGIVAELVAAALIVTAAVSTRLAVAVVSFAAVWLISVGHAVWTRFNQEYRLSVAETPDGLRIHAGLVALTTETIRPGRVQAVRMVEPFFWRWIGWCRVELDIAGRQREKGEGRTAGGRLRAVLPVGSRAVAEELLDRLLPDRPRSLSPPPRRARWKSPLRYPKLGWGSTPTCVVTRSGRLRRVTYWVPLGKVQSFRRVQGPVQRRLGLVSIYIDVAGRRLHATLRDRDIDEGDRALVDLTGLARAARRGATAGAPALTPR